MSADVLLGIAAVVMSLAGVFLTVMTVRATRRETEAECQARVRELQLELERAKK